MSPSVEYRRVDVERIIPLRHRVLRPDQPYEAARFDGDLDPSTRHYAALRQGEPISCLTLMASTWDGRPAWQLRGMATDATFRRRGIGRAILIAGLADAACDAPEWGAWCNARTSAIGFYERLGWTVASEPFDMPPVGPHVKMVLARTPPRRLG